MKTTVYYKRFKTIDGIPVVPEIIINPKGDWIDLYAATEISFPAPQAGIKYQKDNIKQRDVKFSQTLIPLGIAIKLPAGYEAILVNRSSTGRKKKIMLVNAFGVIDNSFSGDGDQWHYPAMAIDNTTIKTDEPFCQFRIQLSQKATVWQKLKWLFSNGIEFVELDELPNKTERGGGCIRAEKECNNK